MGWPFVTRQLQAAAQAILLLSLGVWTDAWAACSCLKDKSPLEQQVLSAMNAARYVALVRVKSTKPASRTFEEHFAVWNPETQQSDSKTKVVTHHLLVAEFEPLRVFKSPGKMTQVETPAGVDACGVIFEPGATYLLYADEAEEPATVSTSQCMRTALEKASAKDIEILSAAAVRKSAAFQPAGGNPELVRALGLTYAYAGCGEERWQDSRFVQGLSEAMRIADEMAASDPLSGHSQALRAELISIWNLADGGKPMESQVEVLRLTDEALQINPALPNAYIARARMYAKTFRIKEAEEEIQKALRIDPGLDHARFAQAEISRLANNSAKAYEWIRSYIEATPGTLQKASGYEWQGRMYRDIAYHPQAFNREANLQMAQASFYMAVQLDSKDPWRQIVMATFLNEHMADFAGAEKYAKTALELEDLPPAHYQLAAARYQALQARAAGMDAESLRTEIASIGAATGLALDDLVASGGFRDVVQVRLMRLQRSAR
jgi:tetratricopeptide (TPR) repeat protein